MTYSRFFFIILLLFFGLLGFSYSYHLPMAKDWIKQQIVAQTQDRVFQVNPADIYITFFPLGVHLSDLNIKPSKKLNYLSPFTIKKLSFILSFSNIFSGHFFLNKAQITGMNLAFDLNRLPASRNSKKALKWDKQAILKQLDLPIASFVIEDTQLEVRYDKGHFKWQDLSLRIDKKTEKWSILVNSPDFAYQTQTASDADSNWTFKTRLSLKGDYLLISNLSLAADSDYFILSGYCLIKKDFAECQKEYKLKVQSYLEMKKLEPLAAFLFPNVEWNQFKGRLEAYSTLESRPGRALTARFRTHAKGFQFRRFDLGQIQLEGSFQNNQLHIPRAVMKNHGNLVLMNNSTLSMDQALSLQTQIEFKSLEVRQLLKDFQLGTPSLHLLVEGQMPCVGHFLPDIEFKCSSEGLSLSDFVVYRDKKQDEKNIVAVTQAQVIGEAHINKDQISIDSNLNIGQTQGKVTGYVNYKSGFHFDFSTPQFNFSDIASLANLKLEGQMALKGFTNGDSQSAAVSMDFQTKDFWFEDYGMGEVNSSLKYKSGMMSFNDLKGVFGSTSYEGDLDVYLKASRLEAKLNSQALQVADLKNMFQRKYDFPFEVYAPGRVKLHAWGPLKFHQLNYDLDMDIDKGHIGVESFDKIFFHVKAKGGRFEAEKVEFHKGPGRAIVSSGKGFSNGQINMQMKASNFYLEYSQTLKDLNFNFFGKNDFDLSLTGHILDPDLFIRGQIEGFYISEIPVSMPSYEIKINSKGIYIESFKNTSLNVTETLIPLQGDKPFSLNLEANQLDFSPLFALLGQEELIQEYETSISGKINISSPYDWFWNAKGFAQFDKIEMQRDKNDLFLKQPMQVTFENGQMNIKDFILTGNNTDFKIEAKNSQKDNLNMSLNGKIDTYMLAFLTPFLEDLRGHLVLNCDIRGSTQKLQMKGNAHITNGYAKLKDIPHPFENLELKIDFSEENVNLTQFFAHLTTGNVQANGRVAIQGWKNLPTQITATAQNIHLHIPEGVQTQGDAQIQITGSWFPFLIKGRYDVKRANVTMEFDGTSSSSSNRYLSLLPESLVKKTQPPIEWDVLTSFKSNAVISNSLIESHFYGDLRLVGRLDYPLFLGEIQFERDGIFKFRNTPFRISTASIQFPNNQEFDPIIFLNASTQVKNYDINLLLQGRQSQLSENIRFESTPSLSEEEIISLIALGFRNEDSQGTVSSQGQFGYEALNYVAGQRIGKVLENTTGMEGVEVNVSSTATSENFEDVPRVTVRKQWGSQWSTSLSRRLGSGLNSASFNNTDNLAKELPKSDVKVEYQLDDNFSVVGMWEDRETYFPGSSSGGDAGNIEPENQQILGVDLKYELEFK